MNNTNFYVNPFRYLQTILKNINNSSKIINMNTSHKNTNEG